MKITKSKKVERITEEIEVKEGTYYFSFGYKREDTHEFYRVVIKNDTICDVFTNITTTKIQNSYKYYLISNIEDYTDYLGVIIEAYFKGEWNQGEQEIREISQEEFEKEKQIILNRLK